MMIDLESFLKAQLQCKKKVLIYEDKVEMHF